MKRIGLAVAFVVASASVWGCSVKPWIHVFNNSRDAIVIRVGQDDHIAQPAEEVSFLYENDDLAIRIGDTVSLYRVSAVPPEYIRTGWFRGHITFQVEPDRTVLVLKAHDQPPVAAASYPQPAGYPLEALPSDGQRG